MQQPFRADTADLNVTAPEQDTPADGYEPTETERDDAIEEWERAMAEEPQYTRTRAEADQFAAEVGAELRGEIPPVPDREVDAFGRTVLVTDKHRIMIAPRTEFERQPCAIFVDDKVAEAADLALDALTRREAELGDLRFCTRVEHGGEHPEVDAFYDALNERIKTVKTAIAAEVLRALGDVVDGDLDQAATGAWFSRYAACDLCPCSPGVVSGATLTVGGQMVDLWIEPLT